MLRHQLCRRTAARWIRVFTAIAIVYACTLPLARSELPPEAYRQRQQAAPEAVEIEVRSVKATKARTFTHTEVTNRVEAVVQKVTRSASGLKPGAVIRIVYTQRRHYSPIAGPSEVPSLKEGQVCPAYLTHTKEGDLYSPAAGGYSFSTVEG